MIIGWISANGICSSEIPAMAQPVSKCLADVRQLEPNGIEIAKEIYFSHLTFFPIFWQTPVFSYTAILLYRWHNSYLIASVQVNLLNQAPSYWCCFVSVFHSCHKHPYPFGIKGKRIEYLTTHSQLHITWIDHEYLYKACDCPNVLAMPMKRFSEWQWTENTLKLIDSQIISILPP